MPQKLSLLLIFCQLLDDAEPYRDGRRPWLPPGLLAPVTVIQVEPASALLSMLTLAADELSVVRSASAIARTLSPCLAPGFVASGRRATCRPGLAPRLTGRRASGCAMQVTCMLCRDSASDAGKWLIGGSSSAPLLGPSANPQKSGLSLMAAAWWGELTNLLQRRIERKYSGWAKACEGNDAPAAPAGSCCAMLTAAWRISRRAWGSSNCFSAYLLQTLCSSPDRSPALHCIVVGRLAPDSPCCLQRRAPDQRTWLAPVDCWPARPRRLRDSLGSAFRPSCPRQPAPPSPCARRPTCAATPRRGGTSW